MNIHPLFVHFPVAFLLLFCLLEIIRFRKVTQTTYWFYVKAIVVIAGTLGAYAALMTGDPAEHTYHGPLARAVAHRIIEIHSAFAGMTTVIFTIISIFYFVGWLRRNMIAPFGNNAFWSVLTRIEKRVTEGPWGIILAIIGAALISTTGALGGLLAYGPTTDPISTYLYILLTK